MRTRSRGSIGGRSCSGVPGTATSALIGTLSGCGSRLASVLSRPAPSSEVSPLAVVAAQPGAVLYGFAHADDAAAADLDACAPHALTRIQPVLIAARGDDLAVELRRRIEIVVVGSEPGLC